MTDPLSENWIIEYWGCRTMGVTPAGDGRKVQAWRLAQVSVAIDRHAGYRSRRATTDIVRPGQRHSLDGAIAKARKLRDEHQMTIRIRNATTGEVLLADIL